MTSRNCLYFDVPKTGTISIYSKVNSENLNKTLIFPLTYRGLTSELNNLCLGILFCLQNNIQFELYSKSWNAGYWSDFFESFCQDYSGLIPVPNLVFQGGNIKNRLLNGYFKLFKRKAIVLNRAIWNEMRSNEFLSQKFSFPELDINGGIFEAKRKILEIIFCLNDNTKNFVFKGFESELNRLHNSIGLHVRRGDKLIQEAELKDISEYVELALLKHPKITDFFIASDSYGVIEDFKRKYPDFSFFTFCKEGSIGHKQNSFNNLTRAERKAMTLETLRDIVFLSKCQAFVGTYSSNMGRLICLLRNNTNSYSVDTKWYAS